MDSSLNLYTTATFCGTLYLWWGGSTPSPPSKDYHARNFPSQYSQNEQKAAPVSLFLVKQNIVLATKFPRKCDNCRLYLRPDLHLLISRLTVLKQYTVLYPENGSIAETMVAVVERWLLVAWRFDRSLNLSLQWARNAPPHEPV